MNVIDAVLGVVRGLPGIQKQLAELKAGQAQLLADAKGRKDFEKQALQSLARIEAGTTPWQQDVNMQFQVVLLQLDRIEAAVTRPPGHLADFGWIESQSRKI